MKKDEKPAIVIHEISKIYKLFRSRTERIKEWFHPLRKKYHTRHYALKDITLNISRGEIVGIIGQNGSGKSTLFKILASVASPTSGYFNCHGRLTALLELNAGFNKELTGIENIYYLGAIQGFSKVEMEKKLEEILDFAEIGEYAWQPVKNYSSGMAVRLSFSLSINIDPDILITDEALSVGDMRFQQKCYRRLNEFKDAGKTIVICTHSTGVVREFCSRAIWLHNGKIIEDGDPEWVTRKYQDFMMGKNTQHVLSGASPDLIHELEEPIKQVLKGSGLENIPWIRVYDEMNIRECIVRIEYVNLINPGTQQSEHRFKSEDMVTVYAIVTTLETLKKAEFEIGIKNQYGNQVCLFSNKMYRQKMVLSDKKPNVIAVEFEIPPLVNGKYSLSFKVGNSDAEEKAEIHTVYDAIFFQVQTSGQMYAQESVLAIKNVKFQSNITSRKHKAME